MSRANASTLETVTVFSFLAHDIKDGIDELRAFGVVALGPVVSSARLAEDEVVRAEDLAIRTAADAVHGAWLQVHEHGAGHVAATAGFVEVHIDALQLAVWVVCAAAVGAGGIDAMLAADQLPELGADLVAALAGLDVQDLTHCSRKGKGGREKRRDKGERRKEQKRRLAMAMAMAEKP